MVPKPPVDIEWYDDGFSMEEQRQLVIETRKQKKANRHKLNLVVTSEYHENEKDKIISELRQKLAADEEYIKELEDESGIAKLKHDLESAKGSCRDAYNDLKRKYDKLLSGETIKELEDQIASLKKDRDYYLSKYLLYSQSNN